MKIIGITGGIGAGKSEILSYIDKKYSCRVILSDMVAKEIQEPGQPCYKKLVEVLSKSVLQENGSIDKQKMAAMIFSDAGLLAKINEIIHPEVKHYILHVIDNERSAGKIDYLFIEAALLIEEGYLAIVDEMWYIYAREEIRRKRLQESRGYSDEKIDSILQKQLTETEFRKHCQVVIDNSDGLDKTYQQIDEKLGG